MISNPFAKYAISYLLNCQNENLPKETVISFELVRCSLLNFFNRQWQTIRLPYGGAMLPLAPSRPRIYTLRGR